MVPDKTSIAIGIDLGATKIAGALIDGNGNLLTASQVPTEPAKGQQAVIDRIVDLVNELILITPKTACGIGIGAPGRVDTQQGMLYDAVNLGWSEVNLLQAVRSRLIQDIPVWIHKDTNASAIGEYTFGAAQGVEDFVYLGVGSGLGAGIMTRGRLITGTSWIAADLGHLSLDPDGLPCACGMRGCTETLVSGPGLIARVRQYLAECRYETQLRASAELTSTLILEAARKGDPLANAALRDVGNWLGLIMAICVVTVNPAMIVIGGGLGLAAFDFLAPAARQSLVCRTLADRWQNLAIVPSQVRSSAVGAACLVWYSK